MEVAPDRCVKIRSNTKWLLCPTAAGSEGVDSEPESSGSAGKRGEKEASAELAPPGGRALRVTRQRVAGQL